MISPVVWHYGLLMINKKGGFVGKFKVIARIVRSKITFFEQMQMPQKKKSIKN